MTANNNFSIIIVIARYQENLSWLIHRPWDYVVLNKGRDLPAGIKNEIKLPNIGREAHSYLNYIISNYEKLPDYVIFIQGNPFEHCPDFIEKINDFKGGVDFLGISDDEFCDDGSGYPHEPKLKIGETAKQIFPDDIKAFPFPKGAQFIVSKKAILFHSKAAYQKIIDSVIGAETGGRAVPFSPWAMERIWETLFDCKHKTFYD